MSFYLKVINLYAKFFLFPALLPKKVARQYEESSFELVMKSRELPLIISFSGLGDNYNFRNTLDGFEVNVLYVRDLKHNWYLNGIPGLGSSVKEVAESFQKIIEDLASPAIVTLGASAGGFAALLYGSMLNTQVIMAFSPQTFVNKLNVTRYLDYRWLDRITEIYQGNKESRRYLDLQKLMADYQGQIILFYDNTHRLDTSHAKRLIGSNVNHFCIPGNGHELVKAMRDSGDLHKQIAAVLSKLDITHRSMSI